MRFGEVNIFCFLGISLTSVVVVTDKIGRFVVLGRLFVGLGRGRCVVFFCKRMIEVFFLLFADCCLTAKFILVVVFILLAVVTLTLVARVVFLVVVVVDFFWVVFVVALIVVLVGLSGALFFTLFFNTKLLPRVFEGTKSNAMYAISPVIFSYTI